MDKTQMAVAVFDKRANEYPDKFMDVNLYSASFDLFCSHVPTKNAHILEIACGPGNITHYLLNKRPDFKVLGIDLAPNMIGLAKSNNPTAEFQLMDFRHINNISRKYEAIMCGFGLPYLSKEETAKFISGASTLLNPKGVLYISTMEGDYSQSGLKTSSAGDQVYIYYHQADELILLLKENGFKIIDLQRIEYPATDGTKTTDLLLLAQK